MEKSKIFMITVMAVLALFTVSAVVVNYLGNKTSATVEVGSPLVVGVSSTETGTFDTTLDLGSVYAYESTTLYTQVENLANVRIDANIRNVVSNGNNNVDCGDLTSVKFTDYWCHGYDSVKNTALEVGDAVCPEQEVSSLCVDLGSKVQYDLPAVYVVGQLTVYPITVTFGNVAPTGYTFETQPVLP